MSISRRRAIGAELVAGGVHFRVWAPDHKSVSVVLDDGAEHALAAEADGYFSGLIADLGAGAHYRFRVDDDGEAFPDPASRSQPDGPHHSSEVIDPTSYLWQQTKLPDVALDELVIYELHVGTFTSEGTFAGAIEKLGKLAEIGINVIEIMPINEFGGRFGWGYDGVDIWAPSRLYGRPDDFRRFVDAAHALGIAVILDVVYNHFGPDGCYITKFSSHYFTKKYVNDWGDAINFDGPESHGVRTFFIENAAYWVDEFHLDGLRLDATQSIQDGSPRHAILEITEAARRAADGREIFIVAENEPQDVRLLDDYGVDALWNDDWHHSATVVLSGRSEAYYTDYRGVAQEFVSMARLGFLYQGQRYKWQKNRRGTPSLHIPPRRFVAYLQNHDQVANSARGQRVDRLTSPGRLRAMTALLLLAPSTPMLFQGQEFGSSKPFLYFADHDPDLAKLVAKGRGEFLAQFPSIKAQMTQQLADPNDVATFEQSKLDWSEWDSHSEVVALHRDLIKLRRDATLADTKVRFYGAVLNDEAFVLRWITGGEGDRLLVVNLGRDLHFDPAPEPLLAPPAGCQWEVLWSSEAPEYGGNGNAPVDTEANWLMPGQATVLLRALLS